MASTRLESITQPTGNSSPSVSNSLIRKIINEIAFAMWAKGTTVELFVAGLAHMGSRGTPPSGRKWALLLITAIDSSSTALCGRAFSGRYSRAMRRVLSILIGLLLLALLLPAWVSRVRIVRSALWILRCPMPPRCWRRWPFATAQRVCATSTHRVS